MATSVETNLCDGRNSRRGEPGDGGEVTGDRGLREHRGDQITSRVASASSHQIV